MIPALRGLSAHRYLLIFGFVMVFLSGHGQTFLISLYGGELRATFDLSNAEFGGLYSFATLMSGLLVIFLGRGVDRLRLDRFTAAVILGAALGGLLLALAPAAWVLVPAFLLLRLCGQGLMTHVAQTTVGRRVQHRRGTAMSLVTLGFPVAEAILPMSVVALIAALGWRGSWFLLAFLLVAVALPLVLMLLRVETRVAMREAELALMTSETPPGPETMGRDWTRSEVLLDGRFYRILPALLGPPILITALFFHQVPIAEAKGWSLTLVSAAFTAYATTHVLSLLLSGPVVDRLGARRLLAFYLLPLLLGIGVMGFVPGALAAPLYLGLAGLSIGTAGALMGALWPELYGLRHLGGIRAMAHGAMVLGTAAGPVLIGLLLDAGLTVQSLAWLMIAYLVAAILLVRPVAFASPPARSAPR
ncbi:MFS transporter [Spiribacter salinus]|uniref:MFS transporter n=1 Tax=Spiribacter salinus TaxID=1335746 RepID=UPI001C98C098|nr:MFS transporter [Spiribacter salinus]MBY5267806.1 MFS transporter [Spiribacter salinus]